MDAQPMTSDSLIRSAELFPEQTACVQCSYSLVGGDINGQCPECGTSNRWSLIDNRLTALRRDKHQTLISASRTLSILLIVKPICLLPPVIVAAFFVLKAFGNAMLGGQTREEFPWLMVYLLALPHFICSVLGIRAHWRLTSVVIDDPKRPKEARVASWLRWIGIVNEVWPVWFGLYFAASAWHESNVAAQMKLHPQNPHPGQSMAWFMDLLLPAIWYAVVAINAAWTFLMARFVMHLAPRVPSDKLLRQAKVALWLGPTLAIVGGVFALSSLLTGIAIAVVYSRLLSVLRTTTLESHKFRTSLMTIA